MSDKLAPMPLVSLVRPLRSRRRDTAPRFTNNTPVTDKRGRVWVRHGTYAQPAELYRDPGLPRSDMFMLKVLMDTFDAVRRELNQPLFITSGRRSETAQEILRQKNKRAAQFSAHTRGAAIDVLVPAHMSDSAFAELFRRRGAAIAKSMPRTGYVKYRESKEKSSLYIHVDFAPIIFTAGDPASWAIEGLVW